MGVFFLVPATRAWVDGGETVAWGQATRTQSGHKKFSK